MNEQRIAKLEAQNALLRGALEGPLTPLERQPGLAPIGRKSPA
jgi:hypothetical protein